VKKILVVDDETDVQFLFEQRFRREIRNQEIKFSYAHSGEEALSYLNEDESEFVIILSDINMPGMSGLELLKSIRTTHPLSPPTVMMITAYGDTENYDQAMQAGANAFLTKPLNFNELKEKLNNTI
jgi:CheY-like chemotaxis protein